MKWKHAFLAMFVLIVVLLGVCTILYEENTSLRLQQPGSIVRDSIPRIGIVVALPLGGGGIRRVLKRE